MLDPLNRWREFGEKPDFAGLLTYAGCPYTEDATELRGADVAVIGAPMDDLVSDRPGARFAPRAIRATSCPPGVHLTAGVDAFEVLQVLDFGDAPVLPADPRASHAAIELTVAEVLGAEVMPVVLGGDHSITEPALRAVAAVHGPVGLVQFDSHTDTGTTVFGAELSHGTGMRHLVDDGIVDPSRYVQIGLRGYWPGPEEFAWQRERGITSILMEEVASAGIAAAVARALEAVGSGPVALSVDVDVLDPGLVPGTGTPEPGGMTVVDLLSACRAFGERVELVYADVVEVIPTAVGSADAGSLAADRVVREVLTGVALARQAE